MISQKMTDFKEIKIKIENSINKPDIIQGRKINPLLKREEEDVSNKEDLKISKKVNIQKETKAMGRVTKNNLANLGIRTKLEEEIKIEEEVEVEDVNNIVSPKKNKKKSKNNSNLNQWKNNQDNLKVNSKMRNQ